MLVDTNIVISALFFEGNERRLIELLSKDGDLVLSEAVLQEMHYVASGWPDGEEAAARFKTSVLGNQMVQKASAQPKMRVAESLVRDKNDAPILAAFLASGADYLVTGDKDLLSIGRKDIINTRTALEILGKPAK